MEQFDIPQGARLVMSALEDGGFPAYAVGGCVRDSLLGLTPKDWDIATPARPEEVKRLLAAPSVRTIDTGIRHGTVTADLGALGQYEVTTFRVDGPYSDSRRPDRVEFVPHLVQDLARRDFTVNAMAYRPETGLADPFHGAEDLRAGVIACVGDPAARFGEDALRILRALRFSSVYGFSISPATARAIRAGADTLDRIAAERVNRELCGLLRGAAVLPVLLEYSGVMAAIIPELGPCIGFDQHRPAHCYTVYDHIAHAVDCAPEDDLAVRLALLLHDVGKPRCFTMDEGIGHFHGHAAIGGRMADQILARLRFDNRTRATAAELVRCHCAKPQPVPEDVRRWLNRLGPAGLRQLLAVQTADALAHAPLAQTARLARCRAVGALAEEIVAEGQCFTLRDMRIGGADLLALGVPPGRRVGELLRALLDEVIGGTLENETAALTVRAAELAGKKDPPQ